MRWSSKDLHIYFATNTILLYYIYPELYYTILYMYDIYRYRSLHLLLYILVYIYIYLCLEFHSPHFFAPHKFSKAMPCSTQEVLAMASQVKKTPSPSGKSRRRVISQPVVPQVGALKQGQYLLGVWQCCVPPINPMVLLIRQSLWKMAISLGRLSLFSDKPICPTC